MTTPGGYAAVDRGVSQGVVGSGAVYGVGSTPEEALARAAEYGGDGCEVVPCSAAAMAWIELHGGAPQAEIYVGRIGVDLAAAAGRR